MLIIKKILRSDFSVLFFLLISILIISCTESANSVTTISFNPQMKPRSVSDTGIFKEVRLVQLESDSCIVGRVDKIICNDSLIYILDADIAKEVLIFSKDGKFVNKISRQGHGKYEYTQLWDIFFDREKNELCLLSRYDQKMISFTPDGKTILEERCLPKMFSHILPIEEGYIGYMQNYSQNPSLPFNIWTMDKFLNLLDGFVRINPQLESRCTGGVNTMSVYGEVVYFKPEYENIIYQIKDGKVSQRYILDFGSKTFPSLSTVSYDNEKEWMKLKYNKISNINNYVETDKYLLMDFSMNAEHWLGIYNKRKHTAEIASLNNYNGEYSFSFGRIRGMDQSAVYSTVEHEDIYELWRGHNKYVNFEEKFPQQVKNLRKLFPHLKEDGNPFIAIYSL